MLIPAFSTVACPDWTLKQVADRAEGLDFEAVELRTFGDASRQFACDPALTAEAKVRAMFRESGVEPMSLATGLRFDEPIWPPVLGLFSPAAERSVREAKRAIDLAVGIECPLVRVFGFEYPPREKRANAHKRICDRLQLVADHAEKTGVRVMLENGGSFPKSTDLMEIINEVDSELLGACYSLATGVQSGEDPADAIANLGDRLWAARIKDAKDGFPVFLGEGELACREFVGQLVSAGVSGPLVFEWDRAWIPELAPAAEALKHASQTLYSWLGAPPLRAASGQANTSGDRATNARSERSRHARTMGRG
jgi:sugar phosphate isomerase/epimerase